MANKSKSKGNRQENKLYKELRKLIPDIKLTIGSGNSERDSDLISNDFIFEIKHYKVLSYNQLILFWRKLCCEAEHHEKRPILIYKENYKPTKVMLYAYVGTCRVPVVVDYIAFKDILEVGFIDDEEKVYW